MITLAAEPQDEILILQAETLLLATKNSSTRIESEPWTYGPLTVQAVVEQKTIRNATVWRKSWKLNGRQIGHNALRRKLRDLGKNIT